MKPIVPLTLRERFHLKDVLCMACIWGRDTLDQQVYAFVSVLGHRMLEFHSYIQSDGLVDPDGQFNCNIIISGKGEPTQDNHDFMAEKYLYSQERLNVRIFPGSIKPDISKVNHIPPDPNAKFLMRQVDGVRFGCLSTFGISEHPDRALIRRLAETFRAISSQPDAILVYSRKGE